MTGMQTVHFVKSLDSPCYGSVPPAAEQQCDIDAPIGARVLAGVLVGVVTTLCGCVLLVYRQMTHHRNAYSKLKVEMETMHGTGNGGFRDDDDGMQGAAGPDDIVV